MHNLQILMTFAVGLAAALILAYVAHRLKLSPIVGYLLAGIAVGPFTPGFVADRPATEQFAEIGVILLLFGTGLRFHLRELIAVWRVAVPGALLQSAASSIALALLLLALGWSWSAGLLLGMAISVASTVVMVVVLADRGDLDGPIGHLAAGWTVVEDLITVALLLVLPIIVLRESGGQGVWVPLGLTALKVMALVAAVVVLGRWIIPWALERVARTRSRELFTLAVLVVAVGIAVGAARVFGVSVTLGAFMAGLAVGRSEFAARAAGDAVPMRDAFAVLFFVSVGMLCDPRALVEAPLLTVAVLAVVVGGKPLAALATMRLLRRPMTIAVPVAAALAQVGEFSFILCSLARELGLLGGAGWNAMVAASIISIAVNPSLYRWARRLAGRAGNLIGDDVRRGVVDPRSCILVGYGPVGSTVHRLLAERGAAVTVIELNLDTVRRLREQGVAAIYGDVLRPGVLEAAGIATAGSLILSADVEDAEEVIRQTRSANPGLRVLVRCTHLRDVASLRHAGASVVAAGEAEVAVALAEAVSVVSGTDEGWQREDIRRRLYDEGPPPGGA